MLFRKNNWSFKFCLVGLSESESCEISKLITDNGGEICETRNPPVITLSSSDKYHTRSKPVFHINYIRDCVRHAKVLSLVHFIFGPPGFFGCLNSILTCGKNSCQTDFSSTDFHPRLSSTHIENGHNSNISNDHPRTPTEHNYAHGDAIEADISSVETRPKVEHMTEASPSVSSESPTESDFLPEESPPGTDVLSPGSPQEEDFLPDESPQEEDFLPDESPESPVFSPDEDCLPDECSQVADVAPAESTQEEELLHKNSTALICSPAVSKGQNVEQRSPVFVPIKLSCLPVRTEEQSSEQNMVEPDHAQTECSPAVSEGQNVEQRSPVFVPIKLPCLPVRTEEQSSEQNMIEPGHAQTVEMMMEHTIAQDVPDAVRFEELDCDQASNLPREFPVTCIEEITISDDELETRSGGGSSARALPVVIANEAFPRGLAEEACDQRTRDETRPRNGFIENEGVAGSSKTLVSPTILRDEVYRVKTIGGRTINETLEEIDRFCLTSSDTDDTTYEPGVKTRTFSRRKLARPKLSTLSKGGCDIREAPNDSAPVAGPSRVIDLTNDIEWSSDENRTGRLRCREIKKLQNKLSDSQPSTSKRTPTSATNDNLNTTVSSSQSTVIPGIDSDSSEELAVCITAPHETAAKSSPDQKKEQGKKKLKRNLPFSRNIVAWEQREMVKYLINNNCISAARGINVWKQMMEDGFLTHRTPQSLNNHFRRVLLPTIHRFQMDRRCLKKFQKLQT